MLYSQTHFRQVPLEIVKQIVEEQIRIEAGSEEQQETREEIMNEDLCGEEGQSLVQPPAPSQIER
jgi:hypothetical protein